MHASPAIATWESYGQAASPQSVAAGSRHTVLDIGACLCGATAARTRRQVGKFAIVRCRRCRLERLTPQPTALELEQLYGEAYFESSDPTAPGYAAYGAMEDALSAAATAQLGVLPQLRDGNAGRKLLDVGCGYGTFVAAAERAGWAAAGMDYSATAAAAATQRYGIRVAVGDFAVDGAPDWDYDVLTMWDAIEHFVDPRWALAAAFEALKPGGRLVMSTPDVRSWDARLLGRAWYGYTKVPEHLYYFSRDSLRALAEQVGFRFVRARSWGFVRTWGFCADKLGAYHSSIGRASRWITDALDITDRKLFFPVLDMLVECERPVRPTGHVHASPSLRLARADTQAAY